MYYLNMTHEEQEQLNREHAKNPQVGDFWHEIFSPYFLVVEITKYGIIVLDKTRPVDKDHYIFDETKPRVMTLDDLYKMVTYETMRDKFVADCRPKLSR
jgi:hypothetical protein